MQELQGNVRSLFLSLLVSVLVMELARRLLCMVEGKVGWGEKLLSFFWVPVCCASHHKPVACWCNYVPLKASYVFLRTFSSESNGWVNPHSVLVKSQWYNSCSLLTIETDSLKGDNIAGIMSTTSTQHDLSLTRNRSTCMFLFWMIYRFNRRNKHSYLVCFHVGNTTILWYMSISFTEITLNYWTFSLLMPKISTIVTTALFPFERVNRHSFFSHFMGLFEQNRQQLLSLFGRRVAVLL